MEPEYRELLEDYRVKIYNLRDLQEENYKSGWREIIAVFKRSKDKEAMKAYYLEYKERFRLLDVASINVMGVLIGKRTLKLFPQEEGDWICVRHLKMEDAALQVGMSKEMFQKKMYETQI